MPADAIPSGPNQSASPWSAFLVGHRHLLLVLAGTAVLGSVSLIYPFGRDQGIYGFLAGSLFDGKVLYRDIWAGVPPLAVYLHALAFTLFGRSMTAIRIVDLIWTMATAGLLFEFVRRAFGRRWLAVTAGVSYSYLYYLYGFWDTAQVDGFLNLPVVAAFLIALPAVTSPDAPGRLRWFWVGMLLGIAFIFKYPIAVLLPCLGGFALYAGLRDRKAGVAGRASAPGRKLLLLVLGFLAPVLLALAIIAASGALPAFLSPVTHRALAYPAQTYLHEGLLGRTGRLFLGVTTIPDFGVGVLLAALGLYVTLLAYLRKKNWLAADGRLSILLVWLWLGLALLYVFLQGRFFPYHFLPALPALACLSAPALTWLWENFACQPPQNRGRLLVFGALVFAAFGATSYSRRLSDLYRVTTGRLPIRRYWLAPRHSTIDFDLSAQANLADYFRWTTAPNDRVLVWGNDPLINFLAGRPSATRFAYNLPLTSVWSWPGLREEFLRSLAADLPQVVVVVHRDSMPQATGQYSDSYTSLQNFKELRDLIVASYELEAVFDRYDVLRRKNSEDSLPMIDVGPELLKSNLREALRFIPTVHPARYKTILWPWHPDSARALLAPELRDRVVSYRRLSTTIWQQEADLTSFLPALSVWIKGDNRPFAKLNPYKSQEEMADVQTETAGFTLLYASPDRTVLVYLTETGSTPTRTAP